MNFHTEVLSAVQKRVLARLGPLLTPRRFYLTGGTAVALQLAHRRSADLDWFTAERLPDPLRLAQELREAGVPFHIDQVAAGTLHGRVSAVRVSLLEYRYPLLKRFVSWPALACRLASLADLAAMKLVALAQRGSKKDFIDVYALGVRHATLRQMLRWYQAKYGIADVAHVLYSLAYFEDAERERMPRMLWDIDWQGVKGTIRRWQLSVAP